MLHRHLYSPILLVIWLMCFVGPSFADYLVEPVVCTNVSVNLRYDPPLPEAGTKKTVTTRAVDHGVWYPCQLGALRTSISYYLTLTATNANCERATFSDFIFTGFFNCTALGDLPASAKNLTVPLTDSNTNRQLNKVQTFLGPIVVPFSITVPYLTTIQFPFSFTVPGFGLLYSVNFPFIFPQETHQPGTCGEITSERVAIIPQLYLIDLPNYPTTPIIPPVLAECQ